MADIHGALQPTKESFTFTCNPNPNPFLISQNPNPCDFSLERGPRYNAYAELRESRLRMKQNLQQQEPESPELITITPTKKRVTFQCVRESGVVDKSHISTASMVARSVPDFSTILRKENRKPALDMTPPSNSKTKVGKFGGGNRSAGGSEKRVGGGGLMARKSCASIAELKGMASGVACAINGEGKGGGRNSRVVQKTILGQRHY